jgi:putative ABC transport system permease protein
VGLALTLVLFFNAIFSGAQGRLTAYIDSAGADVWVSQEGVRTMHMSESALPATVADRVKAIPGVEDAIPILYTEGMIEAEGRDFIVYVFGVPAGAPLGGPSRMPGGAADPGPGEVVIDHAIASQAGVGIGDRVTVLGQQMTIAGLTSRTSSLVSSVSFVSMADFARVRGSEVISFVLVKIGPGESSEAMSSRIAENVSGVTVQTREEFASQERRHHKHHEHGRLPYGPSGHRADDLHRDGCPPA